jgi:sugar/nucleoside kinase (ribokinase family)
MFYTSEGSLIQNPNDPLREMLIGFEYGAKITSPSCHFMLGGGGCNVAVGTSRLGLRTAAIISLGDDRDGDAILHELRDEAVDPASVKRHANLRTGFSFIVVSTRTGEHVAFLYRGANDALAVTRMDFVRRRTRWIYCSSLGASAWGRISPVLLEVLRDRPIKLAWNPGEAQLTQGYQKLKKALERTDVLLLNQDEARELVLSSGVPMTAGLKRVAPLCRAIKRFGPALVVITDGARGATVYNGHELFSRPAMCKKAVDTTGAGDAFGSGFIAGLRHFHDLEPALRLALRNSASVCSTVGTQRGLLSWSRISRAV